MNRITIRGLCGPHMIEATGIEQIVTLQNTPTVPLPEGTHKLSIYKVKARQYNRKLKQDQYQKGELVTEITVTIPDEKTIYV